MTQLRQGTILGGQCYEIINIVISFPTKVGYDIS
jgi:hypothetical protein